MIGRNTPILKWLLSRIQASESPLGQNKQYAAEVLAILLQSSADTRSSFLEFEGIDTFLQLLSPYRKRDPVKGSEEEEYVENLFDCVTCCVDDRAGKDKFLVAEGIELCLIMLREGKMSRPRALRLLDHALGGSDGGACCERLVEGAGLKITFSLFIKKVQSSSLEPLTLFLSSLHESTIATNQITNSKPSPARHPIHRTSPRSPLVHAAFPPSHLRCPHPSPGKIRRERLRKTGSCGAAAKRIHIQTISRRRGNPPGAKHRFSRRA